MAPFFKAFFDHGKAGREKENDTKGRNVKDAEQKTGIGKEKTRREKSKSSLEAAFLRFKGWEGKKKGA